MVLHRAHEPSQTEYRPEHLLTPDTAREYVAGRALTAGPVGSVGLELESHLVDLAAPGRRVGWDRITGVVAGLPPMPGGSRVTLEPGGQIELSGPPSPDLVGAIDLLNADQLTLRAALAEEGLGAAGIGADPARPARRVHPGDRYAAMESHFIATGNGEQGRAMMCSTASLQVNLDAGPEAGWADRVRLAQLVGPVLVALSACSPMLAGEETGWRSNRQHIWGTLDQSRCGPMSMTEDPASDWAEYAMRAPVMLVHDAAGAAAPVRSAVPFGDWVAGAASLGDRAPVAADLDYHLTTLFPPLRLRGFLEIRSLDAVPARWWPALAAVTTVLLDDPVAADLAAEACEPVAESWTAAARVGIADPALRLAALSCLSAVRAAVPPSLKADVDEYADLVETGRTPGDDLLDRSRIGGPLAVLEEEAHA